MNQPHLSPEQLAKLEETYKFAQGTEKITRIRQIISSYSSKWQQHKVNQFPSGWDEQKLYKVIEHYENQSEDEAVVEDEN